MPFILGLTYHSSRRSERRVLMANNARAHAPLVAMTLVRLLICTSFVVYVIGSYFGVSAGIIFGVSLFVLALIFVSRKVRHRLARIESRFLDNLNERELRRTGEKNNLVCNMHMAYGTVGYDFPYVGDRLCISNVGRKFKINIASIQRGGEIIPVPGADERLFPGDVVGVIGTEENISAFMNQLEQGSEASETRTGKEDVEFTSITLSAQSPLPGKTLEEANLRNQLHTLVVAIERAGEFLTLRPNEAFREGDTVWLVAQPSVAKKLV